MKNHSVPCVQLFGVIILGVIEQNVLVEMYGETGCAFDMNEGKIKGNKNACNFGLAVGVLALIAAIVLTAIDLGASVLGQSGETAKKLVTIADLISSVVMAFLSLAAFAYLTDLWTKTGPLDEIPGKTISSARAAIAFCFLSAIIWVSHVLCGEAVTQLFMWLTGCACCSGWYSIKVVLWII